MGLISTPKFTPISFYNSLPYFTKKPQTLENTTFFYVHFLYFTPLRNFIVLSPRILVFFAGITQLYRTCGKIATYQYAPQEISQFWRFSPPSHSIVPLLPAFGGFRERHGQPPGSPTQFPILTRSFCDPRVTFSYLRSLDLVCRKIPAAATVSASVHAGGICLT